MPVSLAASNDPAAEAAAQAAAADGGGSIDAVVAGFFGAAGADPGALLSPTVAIVGGVGVGARCLDGRALQPGRGASRPRGFVAGRPIPEGSYGAISRSVPTLALLHAYGGKLAFAGLVRHGTRTAKQRGAPRRAALLAAIERQGAGALRAGSVRRSLLEAAGPAAGGLLTEDDLDGAMPGDLTGVSAQLGADVRVAAAPWCVAPPPEGAGPAGQAHRIIVAADGQGLVVALGFAVDPSGLELRAHEISLPRLAAPVLRGVPRVTPGTPRELSTTIGVLERPAEGWFAAAGLAGRGSWAAAPASAGDPSLRELLERAVAASSAKVGLAVSAQRGRTAITRAEREPGRGKSQA